MKRYFFIMARPRSGTSWLAAYLTSPNVSACEHDSICDFPSLVEFKNQLAAVHTEEVVGISDTLSPLLVNSIKEQFGEARFVFVDRPLEEVRKSCESVDLPTDALEVVDTTFFSALNELKTSKAKCLLIPFNELFQEDTLQALCEFLDLPFSSEHTAKMISTNVQQIKQITPERQSNIESLLNLEGYEI